MEVEHRIAKGDGEWGKKCLYIVFRLSSSFLSFFLFFFSHKLAIFPTLPEIFATATVVAFVLLHNSRFNFHCYTQREATPTQKSARK